jgi:hypothetical protein
MGLSTHAIAISLAEFRRRPQPIFLSVYSYRSASAGRIRAAADEG